MNEPNNVNPEDWARFNEHTARQAASHMSITEQALCLEPYEIEIRELPDFELEDLFLAVRRAASELEGQGEKSDRIATQLLTALGRFEAAR